MQQIMLGDLMKETMEEGRRIWTPPLEREYLRIKDMGAEVRPLYIPPAPDEHLLPLSVRKQHNAERKVMRDFTLEQLCEMHYMHRAADALDPVITFSAGLYAFGELFGIAVFNPPAAGSCKWLYGDDMDARRRVISLTRFATNNKYFNATSWGVRGACKSLWQLLNGRYSVVLSYADLAVSDPLGRPHTGVGYTGASFWFAGRQDRLGWRGFINRRTGKRINKKCANRNYTKLDCPDDMEIEYTPPMNRFINVLDSNPDVVGMMRPAVTVAVKNGLMPRWSHLSTVKPGDPRYYSDADKLLRQRAVAA